MALNIHQIFTDFQNLFTGRLGRQFATKWSSKFPPRPKDVAFGS